MVTEAAAATGVDTGGVGAALPNFYRNAGVWEGTYRSLSLEGKVLDEDLRCVEIGFPLDAPYHHVSRALSVGAAAPRRVLGEIRGVLVGRELRWNEADFFGRAWDTDAGVTIVEIGRKDNPDIRFIEMITLSICGDYRTRTLHWYDRGLSFKRTHCDEQRCAA